MGNSTTRILFLLAAGPGLLAADALRDEALDSPRPIASATVTVIAEATDVDIEKTPNQIKVITMETLERLGATTVADALMAVAPGQLLCNGGVGTSASFFLGGARSQDVSVTLNGLRIEDPLGLGGFNLNSLALVGVDRIEIQQGSVSALHGANTMGGVVGLWTNTAPSEGVSGHVALRGGNRHARRVQAGAAYGWNSGWIRADAGAREESQAIEAQEIYRSTGTVLGFGQTLGKDFLFTANYLNNYATVPLPFGDYPGSDRTQPRPEATFKANREDWHRFEHFSGRLMGVLSKAWTMDLVIGGWEQLRMEPNWMTDLTTDRYVSRGSQGSLTLSWSPSSRYGFSEITTFSREWAISPNGDLQNEGSAQHLATAWEAFAEPVEGLRFIGSMRQQMDRLMVRPAGTSEEGERTLSATTARLGVNWIAMPGLRFYLSGATGYAHPTLFQTMYNLQNGGPALSNEKSKSMQAGVTWEQGPWSARVDLNRTLFDSLLYYDASLGMPAPWGGFTGAYANGQNVRIQGVEVRGGYRTKTWTCEAFYRNQEARDLDAPKEKQLQSSTVVRRPFQSFGLSGSFTHGALRLDGRWAWMGPRYEYGLPFAYNTHFNDVNLSVAYELLRNFTLTLRGEHLMQQALSKEAWLSRRYDFDNDGAMIYGYPAQPRTVTLEARYRF